MTVRVERWVRLVVTGNDSKRGKARKMGKAGRWVMAVRVGRWVRLVVLGHGSERGKARKMGKAGSHG